MAFFPGQIPSAAEMNALLQAADSAHLGAAGFLAADNGFEQVVRNPRRQIVRGGAPVQAAACQWRVEVARIPEDEGGGLSISCGAGIVEWGGGARATHAAEELAAIPAKETSRLVVWWTKSSPRPLQNDPRWPTGEGAPGCGCEDCDCHKAQGDPNAGWSPDAGTVELADEDWTPPDGSTDSRLIAAVEIDENGRATITQWQRDTIVPRAIVGAAPLGGDKPEDEKKEEDAPPCGNPMNEGGGAGETDNPLDHDNGPNPHGDPSDADPTPEGGTDRNPLDSPGDGGYTPTCKDDEGNENAY